MNDEGFTLAEALAALVMIGLAAVGAVQGVQVISKMQTAANRSVNQERTINHAGLGLARLLDGQGPFRSDRAGFEGGRDHFEFACGQGQCSAKLSDDGADSSLSLTEESGQTSRVVLARASGAAFTYQGATTSGGSWPPPNATQARPEALRGVAIVRVSKSGDATLAQARFWTEQPADCAFDPISQDCRKEDQP
jgi:type II secretory pathway pseudopilin PulG